MLFALVGMVGWWRLLVGFWCVVWFKCVMWLFVLCFLFVFVVWGGTLLNSVACLMVFFLLFYVGYIV